MRIESDRDYHTRRARIELDLAYRAEDRAVMESHLKLSALHMAKLRRGGGRLPVPS
jgi:hypothetical protein